MDLAVARLFEMIEQHFGRKVKVFFLGLVMLAVAVWAIRVIWDQGVQPVSAALTEFMQGNNVEFSWIGVISFLISSALPATLIWITFRFLIRPNQETLLSRMGKQAEELRRLATDIDNSVAERYPEATRLVDTIDTRLDDLDARLSKLERRRGTMRAPLTDSE